MKIPKDNTPQELIDQINNLIGVTFNDYSGMTYTAFGYHHGQVFYIRDNCRVPEYNNTTTTIDAESYIKSYNNYLKEIKITKENNAEQFIKDNGTVAIINTELVKYSSGQLFNTTLIKALNTGGRSNYLGSIFNASFFGKSISICNEYRDTPNSYGVEFEFNNLVNENFWTLEHDDTTESGYESTHVGQKYYGINSYNNKHLTAETVDNVFNKAVEDVFIAIRKKFCNGEKIGTNKAKTKFILHTNHVCELYWDKNTLNKDAKYRFIISFSNIHSKTRYTRAYADTLALPKINNYITCDEFIDILRTTVRNHALPLYELTKKNLKLK